MWFFRSFPQENEKNNKAMLISVKLISVALAIKTQRRSIDGQDKKRPGIGPGEDRVDKGRPKQH
jgi:hypothetical protein